MLNKVIYVGRITNDLKIRETQNNKKYCFFDIAINDGYGEKQNTNFINCIAWQGRAENLVKYQSKGNLILVEGKTESYKNKDNLSLTRCVALDIKYLENKNSESSTSDDVENPEDSYDDNDPYAEEY